MPGNKSTDDGLSRRFALKSVGVATGVALISLGASSVTAASNWSDDDPADDGDPAEDAIDSDRVIHKEIETLAQDCQSGSLPEPELTIDGTQIDIEAALGTDDPCHEPVFAEITIDEVFDVLEVDIGATPQDNPCILCLGQVDYEASVRIDTEVSRVILRHEGDIVARESVA